MNKKILCQSYLFAALLILPFNTVYSASNENPGIFPIPMEVKLIDGTFKLDKSTFIMLPEKESNTDSFLAGLISNEIRDKYELPIKIGKRASFTDKDKFILIGDITNPLIQSYCDKNGILLPLKTLGDEGYILNVSGNNVVVAANSQKGALYGLESLRQLIVKKEGSISIPQIIVRDSPQFAFRGIKLYLPGRENIAFFKRFIRDFAALYKFNKIILELNANMRLERHPELNMGAVEFNRYLNFSRLDRPPGLHMEFQNSSHQDNADGGILEKEEVADIVNYIRKFNIEVIPELPSLTHSYYLLAGHKELAENLAQPFPDTYCPLKPEIYKIYFDVLDEYIDVIHPSIVHIGHDEWRMEKNLCELCRGKDYGQLYADDVIKIHDYLAGKGVKTALWGDHLLESVTKKGHQEWKSSTGYKYNIPGALTPEQVIKLIPKDIIVFNWFWNNQNNDKQVADFGFSQVYGNFTPEINNWSERITTKGLLGGAPSSWAGTTEKNFGKDLIFDFLGTANLLWSKHYLPVEELASLTEPLISRIRISLSGNLLPSDLGSKVRPIDISSHFNSALTTGIDSLNYTAIITGPVRKENIIFNLASPAVKRGRAIVVTNRPEAARTNSVSGIEINKDVNSIIFLHACARAGRNAKAYGMIHNFDETAELLGWYEVIYEDGFIESVPLRYGVNILDWRWQQRIMTPEKGRGISSQKYAYEATAVKCSKEDSDQVTFFSYEWQNPRFGKKIREINIKSAVNVKGENAIILLALSISETVTLIKAEGTENE
jgi:hypothetical protein